MAQGNIQIRFWCRVCHRTATVYVDRVSKALWEFVPQEWGVKRGADGLDYPYCAEHNVPEPVDMSKSWPDKVDLSGAWG